MTSAEVTPNGSLVRGSYEYQDKPHEERDDVEIPEAVPVSTQEAEAASPIQKPSPKKTYLEGMSMIELKNSVHEEFCKHCKGADGVPLAPADSGAAAGDADYSYLTVCHQCGQRAYWREQACLNAGCRVSQYNYVLKEKGGARSPEKNRS